MQEFKLREAIGNSLPRILPSTAKGVYPLSFQVEPFSPKAYRLDAQIAASQLAYTGNWQIVSYLFMDPGQIVKLGTRAFPKLSRGDVPKMVVSANAELLNSTTSRLAFLLGKVDNTQNVSLTPPLAMNFSGENALDLPCADSVFQKLACEDISLVFIASVQMV